MLQGCITDSRFQPVNPESLERNPNKRPTYLENEMYLAKHHKQDATPDTNWKGISTREFDCRKAMIDSGTIGIPVYHRCKYLHLIRLRLSCNKDMEGYSSARYPARFKKVTLVFSYQLEGSTRSEISKTSTTDHEGNWSENFVTNERIKSIWVLDSDRKVLLKDPNDFQIEYDEKFCATN